MRAVVDASFLFAAFPGEPDHELVEGAIPDLRERFRFVAPSLVVLETGNVIHGRHRRRFGASLTERRRFHRTLLAGLALEPEPERLVETAAALAEAHGLSFYDATYLALAADLGDAVLFTQDRQLLSAARSALGEDRGFTAQDAARWFRA